MIGYGAPSWLSIVSVRSSERRGRAPIYSYHLVNDILGYSHHHPARHVSREESEAVWLGLRRRLGTSLWRERDELFRRHDQSACNRHPRDNIADPTKTTGTARSPSSLRNQRHPGNSPYYNHWRRNSCRLGVPWVMTSAQGRENSCYGQASDACDCRVA